jgi:adenylate cyclase class 1
MLRSGFGEELFWRIATIRAKRQRDGNRIWTLYVGDQLTAPDRDVGHLKVHSASTATSLVTWCVINRIIDKETTLLLDYDAQPVTEQDLKKLTHTVVKLFKPVKVNAISRDALLSPRTIVSCLAVVNFESSRLKADVDDIALIYSTSWGERFIEYGRDAFLQIIEGTEPQAELPERYIMVPDYSHTKRVIEDFLESAPMSFDLLG